MPAYDASLFDPPAPLARITLRLPNNGATVTGVPMLLDSGADVTLVQRSFVDQLGAVIDSTTTYEVCAFDGTVIFAQVVELDLVFLNAVSEVDSWLLTKPLEYSDATYSTRFLSCSTDLN